MFGFLIKKSFFDVWDNLITVMLLNLGFVLIGGGALYLFYLLSFNTTLAIIAGAVGIAVINLYLATASFAARDISNYATPPFRDLGGYFKQTWKSAVGLAVVTILQLAVLFVAMPFYLQIGGLLGMAAVAVIFWASVIWWLASQYYYAVRARLDSRIGKLFKKSFILLFDNTLFTIGLGLGTIFILAVSVFTAFLIPGVTSVLVWHQDALKLRLSKYDYLEKNPGANRREIPWETLLIDERKRVGHRTFRGMIFPWKE